MVFNLFDWVQVFLHFAAVSLLAVGGAVTVIPEMHRHIVVQSNWITDSQFPLHNLLQGQISWSLLCLVGISELIQLLGSTNNIFGES